MLSTHLILILVLALAVACQQNYHNSRRRQQTLRNILSEGEQVLLRVWIELDNATLYNQEYEFRYSQKQPDIVHNISLSTHNLTNNMTLHTSLYKLAPMIEVAYESRNLTRWQKVRKDHQQASFFGSSSSFDPIDEIVPSNNQNDEQTKEQSQFQYDMHLPRQFQILVIHSDMIFPKGQFPPNTNAKELNGYYTVGVDLCQLHVPFNTYQRITNHTHSFTLKISLYGLVWYSMFYGVGHPDMLVKGVGGSQFGQLLGSVFEEDSMDEMKEMLFTNHVYLVVLFFALSMTQTILRFFAIKQEYLFWKNIEKNQGMSFKMLFFELGASVILTLYVMHHQSSKLIIAFSVLDVLVSGWKITRTFTITFDHSFPFLHLTPSQSYRKRAQLDSQAVWYMNYLLVPLMVGYVWWSLHSRGYVVRAWYGFILETSVAFIAVFGFIMMTPQLYINYKLRSVEHMNWRGMIYRFINTILDDFFAIMVTMPMLRRLMYFRDDLIFVMYLYQRAIYKVDYSRKTVSTYEQPPPQPAPVPLHHKAE